MKVIGLTGGIASGKTTAAAYLLQCGVPVVDTDVISHQIMETGAEGYCAVVSAFGKEILMPNGSIDRKKLGGIVFSEEAQRTKLNGLLHPIIIREAKKEIENARCNGAALCVLDVPLLFESGMDALCDETWLVYVPRQIQLERLCLRDGLTMEEAAARADSQMPLDEKLRRADKAVDSSGSIEQTREKIGRLMEESL